MAPRSPGTDPPRADLSGADLSRTDLSGPDLSGPDLSDAGLTRPGLPGIDLFVIGAMKAATTGMCDWLAAQPGVAMSRPKEPSIFVSDDAVTDWLPRVESLYADGPPGGLRVEGSTDYAKFPSIAGVPHRLRQHCPEARFVYLMRHPIERAVSQYRFDWLQGGRRLPFSRALVETPQLVDNGRYAFQLAPWLECFPPDRFLLVLAEAFAQDAVAQVERVLQFAGEPTTGPVHSPGQERSNETATLVRRSRVVRTLRRSSLGRRLRTLTPDGAVRAYQQRLQRRSLPTVSDADRETLAHVYDADLRDLTTLTAGPGITCASWHQVATTWVPQLAHR